MNLLWTKGTFRGHPSDESLTEKLSPISRMFINWHVKNCHRCRSRQQALRYVEVYLSAHRQQALSQTGLIFNPRRNEFIIRLNSLLDIRSEKQASFSINKVANRLDGAERYRLIAAPGRGMMQLQSNLTGF